MRRSRLRATSLVPRGEEHLEVARAMSEAGSEGCVVEDCHLGPYAEGDRHDDFWDVFLMFDPYWQTEGSNAWGFASTHGIWMKDWNYKLEMAEKAAQKASVRPLFMRIVECYQAGQEPPFALSDSALARLLDIAILIGDPEAASMLAAQTQARPLRRWGPGFFFQYGRDSRPILQRKSALLATLAAGGDSRRKQYEVPIGRCVLTLREALVFSHSEWRDFSHMLCDSGELTGAKDVGFLFGNVCNRHEKWWSWTLCEDILYNGKLAGLALPHVQVECYSWHSERLLLSLLDLAILQGQRESAEICAAASVGVEVPQMLATNSMLFIAHLKLRRFLTGVSVTIPLAPVADRREAASHAARTALRLTLRRELGERVWVLCKVSPEVLVPPILAFAMEEPQLVRMLMEDFLMPEDVAGWEEMG